MTVQVSCKWWYWTSSCQNFGLKDDKITLNWWFSTKMFDDDLKCIMSSRIMKNKIKLKIVKVMKFTFKTRSGHFLLSITFNDKFEDLILVFYIWVLYTMIEVIMIKKKFNLNKISLLLLGVCMKKTMVLGYWSTFLVHFTMLAPNYVFHTYINLAQCNFDMPRWFWS